MQWPRFWTLLPLVLVIATRNVLAADYTIDLKTSGSVVLGGTVEFLATIMTDGKPVNDQYEVTWTDDLGNKLQAESKIPTFNWTVSYNNNINAGTYSTQVIVRHYYYITYLEIARKSISFNLTSLLNGQMELTQNTTTVDSEYVSSAVPLNQTIVLTQSDKRVLESPYFRTYWFVNYFFFVTLALTVS
ncbi:conserved hypothetical protein [Culex quinquefasciatus]|uniref:Uncharacterized protein n=1 Tax=Culex quinquefasciatus TaxID=7176 RepID=B0XHP7_CULQU|nr:conserved hypothetical protein [Culex quinquefasciatus]|eukprot:XP_001869169.1 conserved hypothetical protein [Culex quinquefasciatus]